MTESSTSMSDEVIRTTGWCTPSEALVALFTMSSEPPPECEKHTWARTYSTGCECYSCEYHKTRYLECENCYETWKPADLDRYGWQEVWDCLQDT